METGETVEKEKISEKNDTIEETSKPRYMKEHTFYTQTEALLSSTSKNELQDLYNKYVSVSSEHLNLYLCRSAPRKVCTILGNGIATYCDKNCHHGEYNSRGEESEITDDDMFK